MLAVMIWLELGANNMLISYIFGLSLLPLPSFPTAWSSWELTLNKRSVV